MSIISVEEIKQLAECTSTPLASIFLPTERGPDARKNPIRFKNALANAEKKLDATNGAAHGVKRGLQRAAELMNDEPFWRRSGEGIALIVGDGIFRVYRAAVPFPDLTRVASTVHILPLLSAVDEGTEFYVLALSQNAVRLLQGARGSITEIEAPGTPESIAEMFGTDESASLQFHTINHGGHAGDAAVFHGHDDKDSPSEEHILKFLRAVDQEVVRVLEGNQAPLVCVGDQPLVTQFRSVSNTGNLLDDAVYGNPEALSLGEMHATVWPLIKDRLDRRRSRFLGTLAASAKNKQASMRIAPIIHAASAGRVDRLFIDVERTIWGRYNHEDGNVQVLSEPEQGCEDLGNLAAVMVLRNGGRVSAFPSGNNLPFDSPVVAQLRY